MRLYRPHFKCGDCKARLPNRRTGQLDILLRRMLWCSNCQRFVPGYFYNEKYHEFCRIKQITKSQSDLGWLEGQ